MLQRKNFEDFYFKSAWLAAFFLSVFFVSCVKKKQTIPTTVFNTLTSRRTGLNFINKLTPTDSLNMFNYMYYYNGGGVGAGDFNNDGLVDLFFSANQGSSQMFLNTGGLRFKDVSADAHIPTDNAWSTGVSVIDINNDGLLDIYVCRVGNFESLHSKNELLICQGIDLAGVPFYKDKAAEYGLDFSGFSTQAAFFDYDMDGDVDMFLMNHGVRNAGSFGERSQYTGSYDSLSGDRLYRNDDNHFTDVTRSSGINSSVIGYGLGICVSDINLDGWPDLYIGNDFQENDYLYINQKNGTFKDELSSSIMHTSQFSMGVDVADINNDAFPDIISLDMLPADPYILKRSLGADEYNVYNMKLRYGFEPQYSRNNLQLNLGNNHFSEIGRYAGISATDWSWSALWMDWDNDGLKDLFISNGIPRRLNDIDFINFISSDIMQQKLAAGNLSHNDISLIEKFPEIKLPNKFFHNNGKAAFDDIAGSIGNDKATFSNGAVYADLDNDGDLDVIVNNIDDAVLLYENKTNDNRDGHYLQIELKGDRENINAIGSKVIVYAGESVETYEKYPVRGFLSSMEIPVHIGMNKTSVDSIKIIWPDNTFQFVQTAKVGNKIKVTYAKGLPAFNYTSFYKRHKIEAFTMEDITAKTKLDYQHHENNFVEFDREPLIPNMVSREGPAVAVADINGDSLEDVFLGSSRGFKSAVFVQKKNGYFVKTQQPAIDIDSNYEDVSACWADVNNDGFTDLIIASGGNEYFGTDTFNTPRVYLNDGKAHFGKLSNAFGQIFLTASCVVACDFNSDGFTDLFIGARAVPFEYGKKPTSFLLQNDGKGHFSDVTSAWCKDMGNLGFVTSAVWTDLNKDGHKDLVVSYEWDGIYAFINNKSRFVKKQLTEKKGWWNFVLPVDLDNDGDVDFVAGNLGLNSRLTASVHQPVRMYYNDFDDNGKKEQLLTYYLKKKEIVFATKAELEKQLPVLKKKMLYAENFAKASVAEMFTKKKLEQADTLTADYFSNAMLINDGHLNFTVKALPWQAQLTCYKDAVIVDTNGDNLPDILLAGNFYENNIQMGRYDADYGKLLINKGNDSFVCDNLNGLQIRGQVRHVTPVQVGKQSTIIVARNNDSISVIRFRK
jgi:hypothetical protein